MKAISGHIVDIINRKIFKGTIHFDKQVKDIVPTDNVPAQFILPGFIDAHVHIESSMLIPSEFARLAVVHGTISTVSDPHEIGNVMGTEGVKYMIQNGEQVPFKFNFGAPSCVPATNFETAGAEINKEEIEALLRDDRVKYLAEMMNWPGVIYDDEDVKTKLEIARKLGKPIDGHAPGLTGDMARKYAEAGISTDHECFTKEEALDKLLYGMKILIREGSAAKNFEALIELIEDYEDRIMFCSDDKHPDNLVEGHINELVKRATSKGYDLYKVLKAACVNPVLHYGLNVGLLNQNDPADFIVVNNLSDFVVKQTYIDGSLVAENGKSLISSVKSSIINNFNASLKSETDFKIKWRKNFPVIVAEDGQLITQRVDIELKDNDGYAEANIQNDILKIAVINRYKNAAPAIGFIKNFGLHEGAIASSVAHDSHNIIVVGTDDISICKAVNLLIREKGGVSAVDSKEEVVLPLPVAGIMTNEDGYKVAEKYSAIDQKAKAMGSRLSSPFMTLSFMALLVIPKIKLSDLGMFDGENFSFIN